MAIFHQVDLNFSIAFLLAIVLMVALGRLDLKDKMNRAYVLSSVMVILLLILEALTIILDGLDSNTYYVLQMIINQVIFMIAPILILVWFRLIRSMFVPNLRRTKLFFTVLTVPILINFALVISTPFTKYMFYIEHGVYYRGDLFLYTTIITYAYLLYMIYIIIRNRKLIVKPDYLLLMTTFTLPLIGGTIQVLFYGVLLLWPSIAFSHILMYLFLQQRLIHLDYLTGCWSRESFFLHIKAHLLSAKNIQAIYFDLNDLKFINDHYGHQSGDLALKTMVQIVKKEVGTNSIIARLGGDEFIAILFDPNPESKNLLNRIKEAIKAYNDSKTVPYELGLAIGENHFDPKEMDMESFLNDIDFKMYQDKPNTKN